MYFHDGQFVLKTWAVRVQFNAIIPLHGLRGWAFRRLAYSNSSLCAADKPAVG